MGNSRKTLILTISVILATLPILAAEDITIQVHLFKGAWLEDNPGLKETRVLTSSSYPAMESLKAKAESSQIELTTAVIDALIETQGLKTVDDLFGFSIKWDGRPDPLRRDIAHKQAAFQFVFIPKRLSSQEIELSAVLNTSKDLISKSEKAQMREELKALLNDRLEKILDTRLSLEIGSPVIVCIPTGKEAFFMMILLSRKEAISGESRAETKSGMKQVLSGEPKLIHSIMPAYPEELRTRGISGQVELQLTVDKDGQVMGVKVTKPLYPYLDFAAVQALRQWKYEPVLQNGKPVPALITVAVNFDPERYRLYEEKLRVQEGPSTGGEPPSRNLLAKILDQSAEYCRKLSGAAFDFICEETIDEVHYNFNTKPEWIGIAVATKGGAVVGETWLPWWDPMRTWKNNFVCDYLFVKKGETIEEHRVILKDNGRKMPDRNKLLEETRFTALNPLFAAVQLIARDRQPSFNYRLIDTGRIHGRKAYVIEAIPKSGNTWGVEYARIWIDQENYQVLQSEIQGVPLEGYDDVLKDTTQFSVKPILTTMHTYEVEKNGVLFPGRSSITVKYPEPANYLRPKRLKLKIEMTYEKYKFFTVETESGIKK